MLTLSSALQRNASIYGNRPAIIDAEGMFTWSQFTNRIARAASVLQTLGVKQGDRFGIISRNSFRNAELMYAGYWMGAVPVPANYRLAPVEIADIFQDSECHIIAVEDHFREFFSSEALRPWVNGVLWITPPNAGIEGPDYDAMLSAATPAPIYHAGENEDAVLQYTGGTTGRSKGVRLSHRNVVVNALQIASQAHPRNTDVFLHVCPMFHSGDLLATHFMLAGAAHVYLAEFSGDAVFEAIEKHKVTFVIMVPGMIIKSLQETDIGRYDLSSLRTLWYGGSSLSAEWIVKALDAFKVDDIIQCYGQTESSPAVSLLLTADHLDAIDSGHPEILNSAGRVLPGMEMRIVDSDDRDVEPGEAGEFVVRGPNVSAGYVNRLDETAAAFRDGWHHTGDVGCMDEHGYLYVLDRKKDMVITGGENVYTKEAEKALSKHPKVVECAVTGIPDNTYGESLLAAIVLVPGESVPERELIEFCRNYIGGYKIPRRYVFLESLPKSTLHKVQKNELRRLYGDGDTVRKT